MPAKIRSNAALSDKVRSLSKNRQARLTALLAFDCFLGSMNSAYASTAGSVPITVHPVHNSSLNIIHPGHTQLGTAGSSSGSGSGSKSSANAKVTAVSGHSTATNTANTANVQTTNTSATITTHTTALPTGYQLDLSSTTSSIVLGSSLFGKSPSVTINVGGANQTFTPGQKVTGAEYVAIQQQLANNSQSIVLNAQGAADGGKFNLNSTINSKVDELVVPTGVTALDYFSKNSSLTLGGDLLNYGSIYGVSTNSHVTSGTISAADITNEKGGVISTILPSSLASTLSNSVSGVNLALSAQNNIINAGTISGSAGVSLNTAQGSITNTTGGSVVAANDVNLQAGNGHLVNGGLVSSSSGNINLTATDSQALSVNNTGGTLSAANGAINVRASSYNGSADSNIHGGNLLSQTLNLNSGNGTTNVNVDQLTGTVVSTGNAAHVNANTSELVIGPQSLSGDPTYYNTGNILINGALTVSESVAIVAGGNITATSALTAIMATNGGAGQNISIIAGANVTNVGTETGTIPPGTQTTTGISFTGASAAGGSVDLSGAFSNLNITGVSSLSGANGGSIMIAAYTNGSANNGFINLPSGSNLNAGVNGGGAIPGTIILLAGGSTTAGSAISIGSISNGAHVVTIAATQPGFSTGSSISFDTHGNPSTALAPNFLSLGTGSVSIGGSIVSNGLTSISSGSTVSLGAVTVSGAPVGSFNALSVTAPGNITLNGSLSAANGITLVSGQNVTTSAKNLTISANGAGGSAGNANITVVAGAAYTEGSALGAANGTISITGGTTSGGQIDFNTNAITAINANGTGSGNGGNVNLIAYTGNGTGSPGKISVPGTISTLAGSSGTTNGNLTVVSGGSSGTAITLGTVTTGTTQSGSGNVEIDNATPGGSVAIPVVLSTHIGDVQSGIFTGGAVTGATNSTTTVNLNNSNLTLMGTNPTITTLNGTVNGYTLFSTQALDIVNPITANSIFIFTTNSLSTITDPSHMPLPEDGTLTGGQVTLLADGNIRIGANIFAPGGLIMVSGQAVQDGTGIPPTISTASNTGNAGNMTIVAGAAFTATSSSVTITGPSGQSGGIANAGGPLISTASSNGNGGNLNLVSFNGNIQTGNVGNATQVSTGGSGANTNGNILAIAQTSAAFSDSSEITLPQGIVSTTGGTGGGGNITVYTAQPNAGAGITILRSTSDLPNGAQATLLTGAPGTGDISFGPVNMPSGSTMTLSAGAGVATYNVNLAGGSFIAKSGTNGNANGDINLGSRSVTSVTANTIVLTAGPSSANSDSISSGSILTAPGGIVAVATGNLSLEGGVSTAAVNPGNITLIAGAAFTQTGSQITITGQDNANGGGISFPVSGVVNTQTTANSGNANGGNFNALGFGGGVNLQGTPVTTGGFGAGSNGNVLIIAGGTGGGSGASFDHTVNTTGGSGGGGNLTVQTATPNATNLAVSTTTSDIFSGTPTVGSTPINTSISFSTGGSIIVNNATIALTSGGQVNLQAVTGTNNTILNIAANLTLGNQNNINIAQAISVNQITATVQSATGFSNAISISSTGPITAPGGILLVSGGTISSNVTLSTASSGNAGNMTLVAGAAFTENATSITVTGQSAQGPSPINMQGVSLNTQSTGSSGNGGDINLIAFGGQINVQDSLTFTTGGSGSGTNGNFTAVAGGTSGNPILMSGINTTGGAAGTGNITLLTATPNTTPSVVITKSTSDFPTGAFLGGTLSTSSIQISGSNAANSNLVGNNISISTGNSFTSGGNITAAGTLSITSGNSGSGGLNTNGFTLSGSSVNITGLGAQGSIYTLNDNKTITATGNNGTLNVTTAQGQELDISGTGTFNVTGGGLPSINLSATDGTTSHPNVVFLSGANQTFNGVTNIITGYGNGEEVNVQSGATVVGNSSLTIFSPTLLQNGSITGKPLIVNSGPGQGTIANSTGPLTLSSNISFVGQSLIILSAGDIDANDGVDAISLANPSGNGGSLTMIAGFNFTPTTAGTVGPDQTLYTIGSPSSGGSINLPGVNVDVSTSSTTSSAGNVLAVAQNGSIQLGNINASGATGVGSNSSGGAVNLIGENGVTVGSVNTNATAPGAVSISAVTPTVLGTPSTIASTILQGGFVAGSTGSGSIIFSVGATLSGHSILLDAPGGNVNLPGSLTVSMDKSGNGGTITLNFGTLSYANQISVPLALNANGTGTGNGGNISVTTTATTAMAIGTSAGNLEFNAASGASGGNGGIASFITGGNLSVNTAALVLTPHGNGNGQSITLTAGKGAGPGLLAINGPLSANGVGSGHGGTIALQSDSTTNFLINTSASTNGIDGALTASAATAANDGTISVINTAGAVVQLLPINTGSSITLIGANAGSSGGSGVIVGAQLVSPTGIIVVNATSGNVTYNTVAQAIFAGNSISLAAGPTGGTIGTAATPLSLDAPTINITGSSSLGVVNLLNFSDGGQFLNTGPFLTNGNFTYVGSGNITINGTTHNGFGSISGNVTITSALLDAGDVYGNIVLGGNLSSGAGAGVVSLTTNGAFGFSSLQPTASAQAVTVNLQTGTGSIGAIGTPFQVNATNLSVMGTGLVDINNRGTTPVTLTSANTTSGFILTSQGQININTGGLSNAGAIVLQAQANNGGVAINNVNLGGAATTGGITLGANGTGLLSETGSGTVIGNGPMSLTAQTGGIFLNINTTGNLTATGTGVVSLGNLNFGSDTVVSGAGGTKWTYGSNGSLVLNNITVSNGFIIALAAGNLLQVNPGSAISATNGQIILENANTASGSIVIGANSFIHTGGTGGPVNIVIGAVPVSPVPGTKPSNFHIGTNTGGSASFGTNSVANPSSIVTLNLAGDNIVFNTGTRPASAISVGGGSTITADPVGFVGSASPAASVVTLASIDGAKQTSGVIVTHPSPAIAGNESLQSEPSGLSAWGPALNAVYAPSEALSVNSTALGINSTAVITNNGGLSPNSGLTSAINGAAVLNSILGSVSNVSTNAFNYVNNSGTAKSANDAQEGEWITETEVVNGRIPAALSSDDELGVKQDQGVSTVVDMDEQEQALTQAKAHRTTTPMQPGMSLQGAVSRTAGGARVINLKTGSVVFAPSRDTVVNTDFGAVRIAAKSVVLIMATRQGVAVFDLDDAHGKAVSIETGEGKLTLAPGLHALITHDSVKEYADVNPAQLIGHRNLRSRSLGAGRQAFVSEFSLPQALSTVMPLKMLMNTKHPHGQKVADHLLKTTAILAQTHPGGYEQVFRRTLTAYGN